MEHMLIDVDDDQRRVLLGAMREVATGGDTEALTPVDRTTLIAANTYLFRSPDPLDVEALAAVTPPALAEAFTGGDVDHAAQLLTVMAVVDGVVDDARIATVLRFADALGVDADYLHQLSALAEQNLKWLIADVQRQNLRSIVGHDLDMSVDEWIVPYHDNPDPELEARYRALGELPEKTLGRAFHDFYVTNGFAFPGARDGVNAGFGTPHDTTHVLSGYSTTPQGEILVSTFTAGMHPDRPMSGHILPVIMTWHMGVELVHFVGEFSGALDPEKFWVAWERGSEVTTDVFDPDWDFWTEATRPLDEIRADYAVPPLDPVHAADDRVPDWYQPSA